MPRRAKDDLGETLKAVAARISAASRKCKDLPGRESLAERVLMKLQALDEFNATKAEIRREVEANIREARAAGDLRRALAFQRLLLLFDK